VQAQMRVIFALLGPAGAAAPASRD
jgi:hypothetical protein